MIELEFILIKLWGYMSWHGFGQRLKDVFKKHGIAQKTLAEHLGVKPSTVTQWVKSNSYPPSDRLAEILEFLNRQGVAISADELLLGKPSSRYAKPLQFPAITCGDDYQPNPSVPSNLMHRAIETTGFEEDSEYIQHIKNLFCIISLTLYKREARHLNTLMRLFYFDYFIFTLIVASAADPALLRVRNTRNIEIGGVFLLLLPVTFRSHRDDRICNYITELLELEFNIEVKTAINGLVCTTNLAVFWLINNQEMDTIVALFSVGAPMVIKLLTHVAELISREVSLNLSGMQMSPGINQAHLQKTLHSIREYVRKIIRDELKKY